jgi:hypothetical protein
MPHAAHDTPPRAISAGGEPIGTARPTYTDTLAEDQIWPTIPDMRAAFPAVGAIGEE